jgi:hypothetical protein
MLPPIAWSTESVLGGSAGLAMPSGPAAHPRHLVAMKDP